MRGFLTMGAAVAVILGAATTIAAAPITEVEFNDTLGTAQVIPASKFTTPVPANVDPTGFPTASVSGQGGGTDVDVFSFTATGGQVYFDIDNNRLTFDTVLSLFDSAGTLLAVDDDLTSTPAPIPDPGSFADLDSFLGVFSLPGPGTYYLAVTQFPNFPTAFLNPAVMLQGLARPGGAPDLGDNFAVLNAPVGDSSFTGALPGNSTAYTLHLSVQSPAGQTVPEPLTLILFGAGMTAAAFRLRRH